MYNYSVPEEGKKLSGLWGSLGKCDIPLRTLKLGMSVAASYEPDIV